MLVLVNISPDFWTARFVNVRVLCLGISLSVNLMTFQSDGWQPSLLSLQIHSRVKRRKQTDTVVLT